VEALEAVEAVEAVEVRTAALRVKPIAAALASTRW